jgi:hypothetical protein
VNPNKRISSSHLILYCILIFAPIFSAAQSCDIALTTSPSVNFTFNTIDEYLNGIVVPNVLELKLVTISTEWDLYIGTTTITPGSWNVSTHYSTVGISPPPVSLIEARVYNSNSTSQTGTGFFPLTDIATPTYIIGTNANDPAVDCADPVPAGTNKEGDYLTSPGCYKFKVDLKIKPGFNYRPGLYTLRVDFILIRDL